MRAIKYRELKRMYESLGAAQAAKHLQTNLREGNLSPSDFSLEELGKTFLGEDVVRSFSPNPRIGGGGPILSEAGSAVDSTAFLNITGQVVYTKILEAYMQEAFVCSQLIDTVPTQLSGERIPGIGPIADDAMEVKEGMPYQAVGVSEDYIDTPATIKKGLTVPVTKEAIFFDRTNLVLSRCSQVGEILGLAKEKEVCDLIIGVTNNHKWKGTDYDTYQATTPWVNVKTSNDLVDWTDVDFAEQLFADILDQTTGEPVVIQPNQVIVTPARAKAARRVFSAKEIRFTDATTGTETLADNPITDSYSLSISAQLYRRIRYNGGDTAVSAANAAKYWFMGDFRKAFAWMENWPITVSQAPPNSESEFRQDIVAEFKATMRGVAVVINPRYVVKSTG